MCDCEMNRDKTLPCMMPHNWTGMQGDGLWEELISEVLVH